MGLGEKGQKKLVGLHSQRLGYISGITIVDVMPTRSVKQKGSEGSVRRPRNLCLVLPTQACKQSPKWDPFHSPGGSQWEFCRPLHFPYKSLSEKRKRVYNSCAERGYGEMTRELQCGGEERGHLGKGQQGVF